MRLPRSLHTVILTCHIIAASGWFALVAVQLAAPRYDFKAYLIISAGVALVTGLVLALASQVGLLKHWWVLAKMLGTAVIAALGLASLAGYQLPGSAYGTVIACTSFVLDRLHTARARTAVIAHAASSTK